MRDISICSTSSSNSKRISLLAAMALVAVAVSACGGEPGRMAPASVADTGSDVGSGSNYRLGTGDRVRITVFGQPDMTGEYSVPSSGKLPFPLIGQVDVAGKTPGELEKSLYDKLHPEFLKNPSISVEVLNYRPFYIIGEVKQPGSYSYVSDMTVLNAIALAGGFTYRAREDAFVLRRRSGSSARDTYQASADTPVLPGDIITVRERYF